MVKTTCILALAGLGLIVIAQNLPRARVKNGITIPHYDENGTIDAVFSASDINTLPKGLVEAQQFMIKTIRNGDETNIEMIVAAPECIFDRAPTVYSAWSAGKLRLFTPTTNYLIEGEGFLWRQTKTNAHLVISNRVHTIIRTGTNSISTTNPPIQIDADRFEFESQTTTNAELRSAVYTGGVRVYDPTTTLTCGKLTTQLPAGGSSIKSVVAEDAVVFQNETDLSRATGDKAIYFAEEGRLQLMGNPRWQDAQRQGTADVFLYDRKTRVFRGEGHAHMRLPQTMLSQPGFLVVGPAPAAISSDTNKFLELSSETLTVHLPPTNGPVQKLIADKNVVFLSETDRSKITAERAVYDDTTGLLELTGHPQWQLADSSLDGDVLVIGRTNRSLEATGHARVKFPAGFLVHALSTSANTNAATNQFLEITSTDFGFRGNVATFRQNVSGHFLDGEQQRGTFECDLLSIGFGPSNQVETVTATGSLRAEQTSGFSNTNLVRRTFQSATLSLKRSPLSGDLETIAADKNIVAEQWARSASNQVVVLDRRLEADSVRVGFGKTNRVETFSAETNVLLRQRESAASGQHAIYHAESTNEILRITGNPAAETDKIRIREARVLYWDMRSGKFKAEGPFRITPLSTNIDLKDLSQKLKP
jgi:lipopolysaccharide export system protein LptA